MDVSLLLYFTSISLAADGDLSFKKGDIITEVVRGGPWSKGRFGNKIGNFPSSYVQFLESSQRRAYGFLYA